KDILSEVHLLSTISSVFIFCTNRQRYIHLGSQYSKIRAICADQQSLVDAIKKSARIVTRHTMAFVMFDDKQQQKTAQVVSKRATSFLWYQIFIDVLKKLPQMDQAKKDMLDKCEDYYRFNTRELIKIEQFRTNYTIHEAVRWFTLDSFVYSLLNRALRTENINLCKQLEYEMMFTNEFNELKENIGNSIATNGFLSTSRLLTVVMQFILGATDTDELKVVLFEIEVNCQNERIIFADIDKYIQLQATDELSNVIEEALNLTIRTEHRSPPILFGNLLMQEFNHFDIAEQFFQMLLKTLPQNHEDISNVYHAISDICRRKEEFRIALDMALKAYNLRRKVSAHNRIDLNESLNTIASIYLQTGKYDRAREYYQKSLILCDKNCLNDHLLKVIALQGL
ncbi:unnamed protein product, partial [Rotaria sp. Silwood1]